LSGHRFIGRAGAGSRKNSEPAGRQRARRLLLGISGTATKVAVEVVDFKGNPGCKLVLHDATDGSQLDFGTGPKGGPRLLLDPNGRTQVYLSNLYCGVRVSSA
jgi:hypothetical protein